MQVSKNKFLHILFIIQTVLLTQTREQPTIYTEEQITTIVNLLKGINARCNNEFVTSSSYGRMQKNIRENVTVMTTPENVECHDEIGKMIEAELTKSLDDYRTKLDDARNAVYKENSGMPKEHSNSEVEHSNFVVAFQSLRVTFSKCLFEFYDLQNSRIETWEKEKGSDRIKDFIKDFGTIRAVFMKACSDFCQTFYDTNIDQPFDEKAENFAETCCDVVFQIKILLTMLKENQADSVFYNIFNSLDLNCKKLQTLATYFNAYSEYVTMSNMVYEEGTEFEKVAEKCHMSRKDIETEQSITKILRKAKFEVNKKIQAATKSLTVLSESLNIQSDFDIDVIRCEVVRLMRKHANLEMFKRFEFIFNAFGFKDDSEASSQQKFTVDQVPEHLQPLYESFKIHLMTYYQLLLEKDANICERELYSAESLRVFIQMKMALYKARKAFCAMNRIDIKYMVIAEKLSEATVNVISLVYTMQKMGRHNISDKDEYFERTDEILFDQSKVLQQKLMELNSLEDIKNKAPGTIKSNSGAADPLEIEIENVKKSFEDYLTYMPRHHNIIIERIKIMCGKRKLRYCQKGIFNDDEAETKANYTYQEPGKAKLDADLVCLAGEAYDLGKKLQKEIAAAKLDNKMQQEAIKSSEGLASSLKIITKAYLLNAKGSQLELQADLTEKCLCKQADANRNSTDIAWFASGSIETLEIAAELVLTIAKGMELASNEEELFRKLKHGIELYSAKTKNGETKEMNPESYLFNEAFSSLPEGNVQLQETIKKAISAVIDFFEKNKDMIEQFYYKSDPISTENKTDQNLVALIEYILECHTHNITQDQSTMGDQEYKLRRWIELNGYELDDMFNTIVSNDKSKPANLAKQTLLIEPLDDTNTIENDLSLKKLADIKADQFGTSKGSDLRKTNSEHPHEAMTPPLQSQVLHDDEIPERSNSKSANVGVPDKLNETSTRLPTTEVPLSASRENTIETGSVINKNSQIGEVSEQQHTNEVPEKQMQNPDRQSQEAEGDSSKKRTMLNSIVTDPKKPNIKSNECYRDDSLVLPPDQKLTANKNLDYPHQNSVSIHAEEKKQTMMQQDANQPTSGTSQSRKNDSSKNSKKPFASNLATSFNAMTSNKEDQNTSTNDDGSKPPNNSPFLLNLQKNKRALQPGPNVADVAKDTPTKGPDEMRGMRASNGPTSVKHFSLTENDNSDGLVNRRQVKMIEKDVGLGSEFDSSKRHKPSTTKDSKAETKDKYPWSKIISIGIIVILGLAIFSGIIYAMWFWANFNK